MNLFDGKTLAGIVIAEAKEMIGGKKLSLGIIVVGDDPVTEKFTAEKEKRGSAIGVDVRQYRFSVSESTTALREKIGDLVKKTGHDGFIVQLPLPEGINTQYILNAIPETKDVDCLNQKSIGAFAVGRSKILPPVVGAIKILLESQSIDLRTKKIVIVGGGRLVGRPVALWLLSQDLPFTILTYQSPDLATHLRDADIVISGAGQPYLITGDMIKEGAVVIDCGTSVGGPSTDSTGSPQASSGQQAQLIGDIDPAGLESKSGWLSPVPGGVGPLTVAYIFKNLAALSRE